MSALSKQTLLVMAMFVITASMASAQRAKDPPWLDMLKADKRLQVKMSIKMAPKASLEAWFGAIQDATGVTLALADPPKIGRIDVNPIVVNEPKIYAWAIMRSGTSNFDDPVWEKVGDGSNNPMIAYYEPPRPGHTPPTDP